MTIVDTYLTVSGLVLQQAAYTASLSWLAWHYERRSGIDAFYLVLPLMIGTFCTWYLAGPHALPISIAALVGMSMAAGSDAVVASTTNVTARMPTHVLLLAALVITVTGISLFDYLTRYQPLSIHYSSLAYLSFISVGLLLGLAAISLTRRDMYLNELLLGVEGRRIVRGWRQLARRPGSLFVSAYVGAWFVVVTLPIASTGVTSFRLLRDVVIALLVSRLIGARRPWLLMPIAVTIGVIRVFVAYFFVGIWAASIAEASIVLAAVVTSRLNTLSRQWSTIRV